MSKQKLLTWIEEHRKEFEDLALKIWDTPEIAFQEHESVRMQMELLKKYGFEVTQKNGMPTAFMGEWGQGGPVVGILGEYDALGGLSQKVAAVIDPVAPNTPGHGCGHNLLGTGGLLAACALKEVLSEEKMSGTLLEPCTRGMGSVPPLSPLFLGGVGFQ